MMNKKLALVFLLFVSSCGRQRCRRIRCSAPSRVPAAGSAGLRTGLPGRAEGVSRGDAGRLSARGRVFSQSVRSPSLDLRVCVAPFRVAVFPCAGAAGQLGRLAAHRPGSERDRIGEAGGTGVRDHAVDHESLAGSEPDVHHQALRGNAIAMINKAVELDPKDPMNWIVLSQLVEQPTPKDPVAPILHAEELAPDLPVVQYQLGNYLLMDPRYVTRESKAGIRTYGRTEPAAL